MHWSGVRPSVCLSRIFLTLMRSVEFDVTVVKVTHQRAALCTRLAYVAKVDRFVLFIGLVHDSREREREREREERRERAQTKGAFRQTCVDESIGL